MLLLMPRLPQSDPTESFEWYHRPLLDSFHFIFRSASNGVGPKQAAHNPDPDSLSLSSWPQLGSNLNLDPIPIAVPIAIRNPSLNQTETGVRLRAAKSE